MKNKGFTLIELVAVVGILAVVLIVSGPAILKILNFSRDSVSDEQKKSIVDAARSWGLENLYIVKDDTGNRFASQNWIDINTLYEAKYLKSNEFKNMKVEEGKIAGVCVHFIQNQFVYTYEEIDDVSDPNEKALEIEEACNRDTEEGTVDDQAYITDEVENNGE
ncbi:MAG: type II secretion system protein [Bacilli bacterium]|nr:type II secretion system protein [Bacilli bacterium]